MSKEDDMNEELKPCQCGGTDFYIANPLPALYQVHCLACGKSAPMGYSKEGAVKEWNRGIECQNASN